jgi:hypothetical protein
MQNNTDIHIIYINVLVIFSACESCFSSGESAGRHSFLGSLIHAARTERDHGSASAFDGTVRREHPQVAMAQTGETFCDWL